MAEEQGHVTDKERLRELGLPSLENLKTKQGSNISLPPPRECGGQGAIKKIKPDLSQRHIVKKGNIQFSAARRILIGN